jgi:hypothetical protein
MLLPHVPQRCSVKSLCTDHIGVVESSYPPGTPPIRLAGRALPPPPTRDTCGFGVTLPQLFHHGPPQYPRNWFYGGPSRTQPRQAARGETRESPVRDAILRCASAAATARLTMRSATRRPRRSDLRVAVAFSCGRLEPAPTARQGLTVQHSKQTEASSRAD